MTVPIRVLFQRKTTVCQKYFGQDSLRKKYFTSNLLPGPLKLDLFSDFCNSNDLNTDIV